MRKPLVEIVVRQRFAELDSDDDVERAMLEEEFQKFTKKIRDEAFDEGRDEERRRLVGRQLEKRFGPLDAEALARVAAANGDTLDELFDRGLTASSLSEVFDGTC